jgi:hypothetical protein
MSWFYKIKYTNESKLTVNLSKEYLGELPIKANSDVEQNKFIELVSTITNITKVKDYQQNQQKQSKVKALEAKIDQLVYNLYELTPEEIKIVEEGK